MAQIRQRLILLLNLQKWPPLTEIDMANCENQDQTAPEGPVLSGSALFAIPSASFGHTITG